jgi:hypothetical protein
MKINKICRIFRLNDSVATAIPAQKGLFFRP